MTSDDLRSARQGDRAALGRLLGRNDERLRRLTADRLGTALRNRLRVSDVLQATYLDALRGIRGFKGTEDAEFSGWIATILEKLRCILLS